MCSPSQRPRFNPRFRQNENKSIVCVNAVVVWMDQWFSSLLVWRRKEGKSGKKFNLFLKFGFVVVVNKIETHQSAVIRNPKSMYCVYRDLDGACLEFSHLLAKAFTDMSGYYSTLNNVIVSFKILKNTKNNYI